MAREFERELEKEPLEKGKGKRIEEPKRGLKIDNDPNAGIPYAIPDEKRDLYHQMTHPLGEVVYQGREQVRGTRRQLRVWKRVLGRWVSPRRREE